MVGAVLCSKLRALLGLVLIEPLRVRAVTVGPPPLRVHVRQLLLAGPAAHIPQAHLPVADAADGPRVPESTKLSALRLQTGSS